MHKPEVPQWRSGRLKAQAAAAKRAALQFEALPQACLRRTLVSVGYGPGYLTGTNTEANRTSGLDRLSRRRQLSGLRIDAKLHDRVRVLISREEIFSGRIDLETSGVLPNVGASLDRFELPVAADRENGDAVMPAVAYVEKLALAVDFRFRRGKIFPPLNLGSVEIVCMSFHCSPRAASSVRCGGHGCFVVAVREFALGMKCEVARSVSGWKLNEGRIVWRDGALRRVDAIRDDLVQAELRDESEPVVLREYDLVRMRLGGSFVLDAHCLAQTAVR